ncbi:MAG: GspH/FimT family protein [Methylicorpusculum sp.]|nr:GspH/FimT family protein [Methylicorpusculum sp.]MDZ4149882.1 GspH/FimT family protein [Methylicorpusculum sp.]
MTLSVAQVSFFGRAYVRTELEKLQALCGYAQQKALMTNMAQTIVLDATGTIHRYTFGAVGEQLPQSIRFGAPAEVKGPPATPTRFIDSPITFKNAQITFYPDGIISAGTVYLTDIDKKICYALTCGVGSVSFLRAYRYDKGWQLLSDG